jgi:hypothetical protein
MVRKAGDSPHDQQRDNADAHRMTTPETDLGNFFLVVVGQKNQ